MHTDCLQQWGDFGPGQSHPILWAKVTTN